MERTEKDGKGVPQSPRFFRRKLTGQIENESTNSSQNKVVLGEVEQKLKSMRQKRLDRLSTFVAEQSKLSEERSVNDKEQIEMENAIMSIKQVKEDTKVSFKAIVEENVLQTKDRVADEIITKDKAPRTPKLFRKFSNESLEKSRQTQMSSTKKFISKFNCTNTETVGSIEDLTGGSEYKKSDVVPVVVSTNNQFNPQNLNRNSLPHDEEKPKANNNAEDFSESYHPLLSPNGKQRRGIYMYESECQFLESERLEAMSTFKKFERNSKEDVKVKPGTIEKSPVVGEPKLVTSNNFVAAQKDSFNRLLKEEKGNESSKVSSNASPGNQQFKTVILTRHSYENRNIIASNTEKPPMLMKTFKTFKRNSLGDALDDKDKSIVTTVNRASADSIDKKIVQSNKSTEMTNRDVMKSSASYENVNFGLIKKEAVANLAKLNEIKSNRKSNENKPETPLRSLMPLPRRVHNGDKILKKFQRNWDSLNDILENDSDVDSDELEDLKKTLEEANALFDEYSTKLEKLNDKSKSKENYCLKFSSIKAQLNEIERQISTFRGLRRDASYLKLTGRLSNFLLEIGKMKSISVEFVGEKHTVLKETENHLKMLETKVVRNEKLLLEVLEAQVDSISTNIFNITKV